MEVRLRQDLVGLEPLAGLSSPALVPGHCSRREPRLALPGRLPDTMVMGTLVKPHSGPGLYMQCTSPWGLTASPQGAQLHPSPSPGFCCRISLPRDLSLTTGPCPSPGFVSRAVSVVMETAGHGRGRVVGTLSVGGCRAAMLAGEAGGTQGVPPRAGRETERKAFLGGRAVGMAQDAGAALCLSCPGAVPRGGPASS